MEIIKETTYKAIADASPLAFIVWTLDFTIIDWNKSAERIFGWEREEAIGKNLLDLLIPKQTKDKVKSVMEKLRAGKKSISSHGMNGALNKKGEIIICEWHNIPLKRRRGKTIVISMAQDITDREKTKERLQKEHNLLQTLMDNIPDSIYFKDDKNRFIRVNRAKAEHSNTIPDEMIGKTDFDFFQKSRPGKLLQTIIV